ncbi:SPFH domain-containing protein [Nocardia sp. NPDC005978]|uniref:SPFH domain-containing protein n=1 Tax=unclassified Nocardia TaxID=2637762 RepID=UPI0033B5E23D
MAWFAREFIAVPDDRKQQLVYKWPDRAIRRFTRALVNIDETALFVRSGAVVATLGPGRHRIDADALPALGALVDSMTGGNFYQAELYFVSSREFTGLPFGGRLADVTDPVSDQVVSLRTHGEFALVVRDPATLLTSLVGTANLSDAGRLFEWSAALLTKAMKIAVAQRVMAGEWPVLGISSRLPAIEALVVREANVALYDYGLRISRIGNLDLTLAPEDAAKLKRLAKDQTYMNLAGDFQRYAAGELALGASAGMAHDAGDALTTAVGMAAVQPFVSASPAPWSQPAPASTHSDSVPCESCAAQIRATARFCMACGTLQQPRTCTGCGSRVGRRANFCGQCGRALTEAAG